MNDNESPDVVLCDGPEGFYDFAVDMFAAAVEAQKRRWAAMDEQWRLERNSAGDTGSVQ